MKFTTTLLCMTACDVTDQAFCDEKQLLSLVAEILAEDEPSTSIEADADGLWAD